MLKALFAFFDSHPSSYFVVALAPTVLFAAAIGREAWLGQRRLPGRSTASRYAGLVFALAILVVLFAWRWPFLLSATEFTSDESQQIAAARTLELDPVF